MRDYTISQRHQRILAAGVSGGADDDAAAEPEAEVEASTPDESVETTEASESEATEASAPALPSLPENLTESVESDLRELHATLEGIYSERRPAATSAADLDDLRAIRERQATIVAELERRRQESEALHSELEALDSEEPAPLPEEAPAPAFASAAEVATARAPQAASEQAPVPAAARPRAAMIAAAGTQVAAPGTELSMADLGRAVDGAKRGRDGTTVLASLSTFDEMGEGLPAPLSKDNGASRNDALIAEAVADWKARRRGEQPARTAAICDPLDIIREIPDAFSAAEPVSSSFPARPAGRLGFQFSPSATLADVSGASVIWDEDDQAAVDPDDSSTWKPCVDIDCPDIEEVRAEAVTGCLTFDITTEMSNPERVANVTRALAATKARNKEARVLELVDGLSHAYRFDGDYGALPALVEGLNSLLAQATYTNRLEETDYTLIIPQGVTELLTIDRANRAYGVEQEVGDVLAYLRGSVEGIGQIVVALDASSGGEPGVPFPALNPVGAGPITIPYISGGDYRIRLVDQSAAIYAETGEMNVGVTRSPDLLRQNKSQFFMEEFFMLAKHGPQPWFTVDITLCADGSRAGLIEPDHCATS